MPLLQYGVLAGRALATRREDGAETPHYMLDVAGPGARTWPVAVNVESRQAPSELLYLVDEDFRHPITSDLAALASGYHVLAPGPGGPNLDYVRANIVDRARMRTLPPSAGGPDNDLADLLDHWCRRAIAERGAVVHAYGERFGTLRDGVFRPANGIHDVHMNQGSTGDFARTNGVWQDGGLVIHYPSEERWVAIFLAFQSQSFHTDDVTGHAIGDGVAPAGRVRIVAALVNADAQSVLLLNASPVPVKLDGWRIANRTKRASTLPSRTLAPGATLRVSLPRSVELGRGGGAITLLDEQGLKVAGVSYTDADAAAAGWNVTF